MKILLSFLLFIVAALGVIAFGIYALFKFVINFQPASSKVLADLKAMKTEIQPWINELIPWDKEEMSLLSVRQVNQKIKRGLTKTAKGVFTSIYNEPLLVYSYKRYPSKNRSAVLYAKTSKHEFAYKIVKDKVDVNVNNNYIGFLNDNGGFYDGDKKRLVARINRDNELKLHPIVIGEKEVASVTNPNKTDKHNPRAFQFIMPMDEKEEMVFLSLAILEMVTEALKEEF